MEAMEKKAANDVQVGGKHYKSRYQHWDFVNDLKLDYYEGCATKYLTRRKGNRKEDLQKAKHFLSKKLELLQEGTFCRKLTGLEEARVERFAYENNLSVKELRAIEWICDNDYQMAIDVIDDILSTEAW